MKMSKETSNVMKAIVEAWGELKNPEKSGDNPFFHSSYAPLDIVINQIRPVLAKHGLAVLQDVSGDGNVVVVSTMIAHTSGEWVQQEGLAITPAKKDPQGQCGAVTYARRYALLGMLNIVGSDEDDDGNDASTPSRVPEKVELAKGNYNNIKKAIESVTNREDLKKIVAMVEFRTWTDVEKDNIAIMVKVQEDHIDSLLEAMNGTEVK